MKKIIMLITASILLSTTSSFAQHCECQTYSQKNLPATQKWYNKCHRKVIKPLQKAAQTNDKGSLEYVERIYSSHGMIENHIELNYVSKMIAPTNIPYASMRINKDTTYYFTNDSLYVFDKWGHKIRTSDFLKSGWNFFATNVFLSFYVYSTFLPGGSTFEPFFMENSRQFLTASFVSPIFDDGEQKTLRDPYHSGKHQYVLDKKRKLLVQYIYEPCSNDTQKNEYTKISYQLIRKSPIQFLDYPN